MRSRFPYPSLAAAAALLFAVLALSPAGAFARQQQPSASPPAAEAQDSAPVRVDADLVTITVSVTDQQGRAYPDLSREHFRVFDDRREQQVAFFSDEDAPASVAVVFDLSSSMSSAKVARAKEALARFVEHTGERDEFYLIAFNERAQVASDRARDPQAILDRLASARTRGQTALYDAVYLAFERVERGAHRKKAVVLISDGQDNRSRYTFADLRRRMKESDVLVYTVGVEDDFDTGTVHGAQGLAILSELSETSGGRSFVPKTGEEMTAAFEQVALELRRLYTIAYRPQDFTPDGRWHRVGVKLNRPGGAPRLFVRAREGYYATPRTAA